MRQILGDGNAVGRRLRYLAAGERETDSLDTAPSKRNRRKTSDLYTNTTDPDRPNPIVFHPLREDERSLTALIRVAWVRSHQFSPRLREIAAGLDPMARVNVWSFTEFERQQVLVFR